MLIAVHVDKIDDDDAAGVPQPNEPGHFLRGFQIRAEYRVLQVVSPGELAGIHIDDG
ncbi:hypothetical protein D3C76_1695110 [compost metagenome]